LCWCTAPVRLIATLTYLASLNPGANASTIDDGIQMLRRSAPEAYWKDFDAYAPTRTAATLATPMLILQGERDYQVTLADLQGWREATQEHPGVTIKSYPTLNHLFLPGEGKSTPSEYERAGHIPEYVLDIIASWIKQRG
jgi:fermentation-respiration switch protein FrsA (DUF1100 family)